MKTRASKNLKVSTNQVKHLARLTEHQDTMLALMPEPQQPRHHDHLARPQVSTGKEGKEEKGNNEE
jgi:hypothetical protein